MPALLSPSCRATVSRSVFLLAAVVLFVASGAGVSPAAAQITNGDFESGPSGWAIAPPDPGLAVGIYDASCGEGNQAAFASDLANPGGQACIAQDFDCGVEGAETTCTITFDYRFNQVFGSSDSAHILVLIDGVQQLSVAPTGNWTTGSLDVPCGTHFLEICFSVDPQDNAWTACVDNVAADCTGAVSSESPDWGSLKARFR